MGNFFNKIKEVLILLFILFILFILFFLSRPIEVLAHESDFKAFDQALKASKSGDFFTAIKLWDQVLAESPDDAAAFSNRGNIRLMLGDPEGAVSDQNMAIKLLPEELDSYLNRGVALEALNYQEKAEEDYMFVIQNDPDNASALYNLGNLIGSKGNWLKAKDLYEKAALASSSFSIARSSKALASYQLGELSDAESNLRNLIRRYPMFADARAGLTALLWSQGLIGEAESNWAAASGLDSRYGNEDWLIKIRRWPPKPTKDLMNFLALEKS